MDAHWCPFVSRFLPILSNVRFQRSSRDEESQKWISNVTDSLIRPVVSTPPVQRKRDLRNQGCNGDL